MNDELSNTPSVAIDGDAARRIREDKRLTQLYVAKVVGVTTDTVSRWENNRYPTIRRENALKLAEALEVELAEILKPEDEQPDATQDDRPGMSRRRIALLLGVLVLAVGGGLYLLFRLQNPALPAMAATRYLPPFAAPGSRVLIRVDLSLENGLKGLILREKYPSGWAFVDAYPAASGADEKTGVVRWIFRNPAQKMSVFYLLRVAESATADSDLSFNGELIVNYNGRQSAVALSSVGDIKVAPLHWADNNGNGVIDDMEILELSEMTEKTGPLDLNWDLIEEIWKEGSYRWDSDKRQFRPVSTWQGPVE